MEQKLYRPFRISCGLREGYELTAIEHTLAEARSLIQDWLEQRIKTGHKVAVGSLIEAEFVYPFEEKNKVTSRYELAFHYQGIIRDDATDEEAHEMLRDLANKLSKAFKQHRIHIELGSEYYILENS